MTHAEERAAAEYAAWLAAYQAEKLRNPPPEPEPEPSPKPQKSWPPKMLPFLARDPKTGKARLFTWSEFDALSKSEQIAALCSEP
jgi:hypothetical protein